MSRYQLRPKIDIDWTKDNREIVEQWVEAYFNERKFSTEEIFRAEMWKMAAVASWALLAGLVMISLAIHL
jgi:hypothetical protein